MTRLGSAFLLLQVAVWAGCSGQPCESSSECGSDELCGVGARCQALSCSETYYAIDPADGSCRPLPGCGNREDVRGWKRCDDPCAALGEYACISDPRCQPAYATEGPNNCVATDANQVDRSAPPPNPPGFIGVGGCGGPRTFAGCRANPLRVDPCAGLDERGCTLNPGCAGFLIGDCGANCPPTVNNGYLCHTKSCSELTTKEQCDARPECTRNPNEGEFDTFYGCYEPGFSSCIGMDEATCVKHPECHAVGEPCYCPPNVTCVCGGGKFLFCEPDDGLTRCNSDAECGADQRCNNDEACAPAVGSSPFLGVGFFPPGTAPASVTLSIPNGGDTDCAGLCVPRGCGGNGEQNCVADPTCEAIYTLNCSPYGGGGFGPESSFADTTGVCGFFPSGAPMAVNSDGSCPPCEPTFAQCVERAVTPEVDADVSLLQRDPAILDAPAFSFANVMTLLAGKQDPSDFVERWLSQLGADVAVADKLAIQRFGASAFVGELPRRPDGKLDLDRIGFQVTSLVNRIDLAGANDCGEARITYALRQGVADRTNRMTVIVELRQPDDGSHCTATARRWIGLSKLKGEALLLGYASLFGPLLDPEHLNQVRTNEFLISSERLLMRRAALPTPWELREWHLVNGQLELALSKQAVDPIVATDPAFYDWFKTNRDAIRQKRVVIPEKYLAVTSSENGSRIGILGVNPMTGPNDFTPEAFAAEQSLNMMACAGCHTTETNSVFTHVAERWNGTGRAKISEFLRRELLTRRNHLVQVGLGRLDDSARRQVKPTH
jgi:hypothetical protein